MDVDVEKPEVVPNRRFHGKTAKIGFFGLSSLYESFFVFFVKILGFIFKYLQTPIVVVLYIICLF